MDTLEKDGLRCRVLADSVGEHGCRLTTVEVRFPRIILAQFRTYGMLSYSVRSSRAVPVRTMINEVRDDPFRPKVWRKSQKGMTAGEEMSEADQKGCAETWGHAHAAALRHANNLSFFGAAKEHVNRLLEPFAWSWAVVTGCSDAWEWLFAQRCHDDAQPEFQTLAGLIRGGLVESVPKRLEVGEWHMPYLEDEPTIHGLASCYWNDRDTPNVSAARCARVSYKPFDADSADHRADYALAVNLWGKRHLSPFEHQAMCCATRATHAKLTGWMSYRTRQGY